MPPKSFKFRLQTVLEFRQKREDEEQEQLARRKAEVAEEEGRLTALRARQEDATGEFRAKQQAGGLDVDELKRYHTYLKTLAGEIRAQQQRLVAAEQAVEVQREILLKASQERKILEKLKDQHREVFYKALDLEEAKMLDELATLRYQRPEQPDAP